MAPPFNDNNRSDGSGFYVPFGAGAFGPLTPGSQAPRFGTVIVRPHGGQRPEALAQALQNTVNKIDANLPLYFVSTPKDSIDGLIAPQRIIAAMFSIFGAIAVLLASVGLYGVMSFSVNQRRQEFGVRMALGADASRILQMVLRQGLWQIGLGLSLGLGAALAIATVASAGISTILFQTSPRDPATYLAVGGLIGIVSFAAALVPARRATKVDPMIALRAE